MRAMKTRLQLHIISIKIMIDLMIRLMFLTLHVHYMNIKDVHHG